ncbi:hypothetical protein V8G54_024555 [Vigna mungo]|uniref:Bet v I/Major latex protein domain-containing protein n=1 Tax=Vigna mungo TaxID=3915 RepID=A0AAQ3N638_VIGMU
MILFLSSLSRFFHSLPWLLLEELALNFQFMELQTNGSTPTQTSSTIFNTLLIKFMEPDSMKVMIGMRMIRIFVVTCERTDGKTVTCHEAIESVDVQKKIIVFKLFGEDVDDKYKVLKLIFEAIEKDGGSTKRSVEYEKVSEDVHPPYGYLELLDHCIKDVDAYLVKAEQNAEN